MAAERVHVFLMQKSGGKPQRIVVWDTQDISVGRGPENDVVVEDDEMSRNHAQFCKTDAGYSVKNLSMSSPTYVNEQPVTSQPLNNKDVVKIANTEFIFYRVTQNPVTLKIKTEYASQLKGFGPQMGEGDGEATILGLADTVGAGGEDEEDFVVRPAGDFENDLHGVPQTKARNLDVDLADNGLGDLDMPAGSKQAPGVDAWAREEKSGALSITLEVEGLTGAQRASVEALLGKVIELPKLRIRLKGRDLA